LNQLTDAEVMVQNALFATLDPTVRQSRTADGITFTYTDTVGFVRNLPHQLVEAFRSTLEEASDSDLLLHIVDASHSDPHGQIHAVREVLKDVDTGDIPELLVFNKADLADEAVVTGLHAEYPEARFVSAVTREGVPELVETIDAMLPSPNIEVTVLIPYQRGDLVSKIYALGMVEHEEHGAGGTAMQAKVPAELAAELADFRRPDLVIGE
ncbi:MAG: 50S ribosome-binding GTPase, partial [Brevibacterium sp.]|nr:50S ribosome-binding GTPase [Brevibacterium sp.]